MQTIRSLVEGFLRGRYSLAELFRVLVVPVLIGAILVAGWLLIGPSFAAMTIPRFTTEGPVVRNGTAVIVACGKKQGMAGMDAAMKYAHEPRTGGWWPERRGDCTVWYHRPPLPEQRENRQLRAKQAPDGFQEMPVVEKLPQSR